MIDLDKLFAFLNSLYGVPRVGLTFVFCIAFGWILKRSPWFPNSAIPSMVAFVGGLVLPLTSDFKTSKIDTVRLFVVVNVVIGFITGTAATMTHKWIIKPLLTKFGKKDEDNSDPPFPKKDGSNVNPACTTPLPETKGTP